MEDRFNFNAIVTGYYDIDTPDEYAEFEPQIYLENVDIWSGGDIGISREDLELAIKNQYPKLKKSQFNQIMKFFEDNSISSDNEAYLTILPYKIIQCTGLKDKNGKLIYEGDIINVKIDGLNISYIPKVVVWDRKEWQLKKYNKNFKQNCSACEVKRKQKCQYCSQYFSATGHTNFKEFYNNEVIGNIYQDKELLNEE